MAARVARAPALQGRDGGAAAKTARTLWATLAKGDHTATAPSCRCCLIEGDSRRDRVIPIGRASGATANGHETGIETLRHVIARHSAPQSSEFDPRPPSGPVVTGRISRP